IQYSPAVLISIPTSSELTNVHGELIAKVDAATIGTTLRIPEMDNSIVIFQNQAQALFNQDSEKYKARVTKSWLKNPKKGASCLSKVLFHADFNEDAVRFYNPTSSGHGLTLYQRVPFLDVPPYQH
ncbi:hypothetical protein KI387_011150, partial [Taxus chinensis]